MKGEALNNNVVNVFNVVNVNLISEGLGPPHWPH